MRINYNVSAAIANKHLHGIENDLSSVMERLSSGFKINHAKDSPSGMAISNKMQAQIDGLNRASKNGSDGISVIHIADGALDETTSVLQRMRELAVQAGNDATLTQEDREAIQQEIEALKEEVDRVSRDTEFNARPLLDGFFDTRVYTDHATRVQISDQVEPGDYKITVDDFATQAKDVATDGTIDYRDDATEIGVEGYLMFNGTESKVKIEATDTYAQVYEKIRDSAAIADITAERNDTDGTIAFTSNRYGSTSTIKIAFSNRELGEKIGLTSPDGHAIIDDGDDETEGVVFGTLDLATQVISYPKGTDMSIDTGKPAATAGPVTINGVNYSNNERWSADRVRYELYGGRDDTQLQADGDYDAFLLDVAKYGTQAVNPFTPTGTVTVNGNPVRITNDMTERDVAVALQNAGVAIHMTSPVSMESLLTGADQKLRISFDSKGLADRFDLDQTEYQIMEVVDDNGVSSWIYAKDDPDYPAGSGNYLYPSGRDADGGFTSSATVSYNGNKVTITDIGGVSFSFLVDQGYVGEINFEVTDMGRMTIHIGANTDQNMQIRIPEVSCETLYIDDLDVTKVDGADRAMDQLDSALSYVGEVRSRLGAYENRLEYAVNSLDTFEENMTNAISRLKDADMAKEMTDYTHQNVLNQAAISVLTQANELPQQVLQILQ